MVHIRGGLSDFQSTTVKMKYLGNMADQYRGNMADLDNVEVATVAVVEKNNEISLKGDGVGG